MSQTMTHRERVMAAVSHRQPDRVPIDLGGTRNSTIVVEGYERLKRHFGITSATRLCDRMMRVVEVDEGILQTLDIDTRAVFPGPPLKGFEDLGPRSYRDMWGVVRIQPEGSYYCDLKDSPLKGEITVSDIARYPWPDPDDPGHVAGLKERVRWIRENTDCAAILALPPPFVHLSQYLRGFEEWYMDFVLDSKRLEALFDAVMEVTLAISRRQLLEVGNEVDIVLCSDDLGTQQSLQMSYDHYSRFIRPRHAKYFRQIHDLSPAKLFFHSCGSLAKILDDLVDTGVEILNPVQPRAAGMDPVELKKKYRGRLALWGGTDSQGILPRGSVGDVKRMVEDLVEKVGEGGGFVLAACHNIQPDVPVENILALFEHGRTYIPSYLK
jgi:uroporphyrinogen decarboxylase